MITIIKKKINMNDKLKTKINWSCKFNNRPFQIIEGYLRIVEHTNLVYVENYWRYIIFILQWTKTFLYWEFKEENEYLKLQNTTLKKYIPNIDKDNVS